MPPPHNGNERLPFAQLVQLEKIDSNTFRSVALPFTPRGRPRDGDGKNDDGVAYGGHVFMQAAWAACRTVPGGDGDGNGDGRRGFLLSVSVSLLFFFFFGGVVVVVACDFGCILGLRCLLLAFSVLILYSFSYCVFLGLLSCFFLEACICETREIPCHLHTDDDLKTERLWKLPRPGNSHHQIHLSRRTHPRRQDILHTHRQCLATTRQRVHVYMYLLL